jgi:hypothetical protein
MLSCICGLVHRKGVVGAFNAGSIRCDALSAPQRYTLRILSTYMFQQKNDNSCGNERPKVMINVSLEQNHSGSTPGSLFGRCGFSFFALEANSPMAVITLIFLLCLLEHGPANL